MSISLTAQFGGDAVRKSFPVTDTYALALGPIDIQNYPVFSLYVENVEGDTITSALIETAPEADGPWSTLADVDGGIAGGGSVFATQSDQAVKLVRVRIKCDNGDSATANLWLCVSRYGR